jgi:hypothetical protein
MTTGPGAEPAGESLPLQAGTMRRAALMGGAILAVVGVLAWFGFAREAPSPLERFQRLGPAGAAAALKAELLRDFPPGSPVTPAIQRLQGLGLGCTPPSAARAQWKCILGFRTDGPRSQPLRASLGVAGDRILSIETSAEGRGP